MGKVFGIDLGTTYSCIAYIDSLGKPTVLKNAEGELTTPSVVYFESEEEITVGSAAKQYSFMYPEQVVSLIKRQMGVPDFHLNLNGIDRRPEEISAYILKKVVKDAEDSLREVNELGEGEQIRDVVITCPAYFGVAEREATKNAGLIAGLNVLDIINEPTAAAVAYGLSDDGQEKTVLVYDLGGGTFDVTMIDIKPGVIKVVCTGGDHNLGGQNWDDRVMEYVAEEYQRESGIADNILDDTETRQALSLEVEKAKKLLTAKEKAPIPCYYKNGRVRVELTREKFDELTEDLLDRTISLTREMLQEAGKKGYKESGISEILLVGGSSYMPQVMTRVKAEFGLDVRMFDPNESVAKGAAIFANKKANETKRGGYLPGEDDDVKIINVSSRSFGTVAYASAEGEEKRLFNIILRNAELPATGTNTFYPRYDGQRSVRFTVQESLTYDEIVDLDFGEDVGVAVLELPEGATRETEIEVTFQLDESGLLHLHAKEKKDGREVEAEFQTAAAISKEELDGAIVRGGRTNVS